MGTKRYLVQLIFASKFVSQSAMSAGSSETFDSSWKPVVYSLRLIGIDLRIKCCDNFSTIWLITSILFNLTIRAYNCWDLAEAIAILKTIQNVTLMHSNWTLAFDMLFQLFHSLGIHFAVVFIVRSRWSELLKAFQLLETFQLFNREFYCKVKKFSSFSICIFLMLELQLVLAIVLFFAWSTWPPNYLKILMNIVTTLTEIYRLSGPILFMICSLSICAVFDRLSRDIEEKKRDANVSSIQIWRHLHALACQCVDRINDCFGLVLLIDTTCIFVRVISSSFQVYLSYRQQSIRWRLMNILNTCELCLQLWFIALLCDKIRNNAVDFMRCVRNLPSDTLQLEKEVGVLMHQIYHSIPVMTATGIFQINLKLIPALLGTTLTYLVILYQFHS